MYYWEDGFDKGEDVFFVKVWFFEFKGCDGCIV